MEFLKRPWSTKHNLHAFTLKLTRLAKIYQFCCDHEKANIAILPVTTGRKASDWTVTTEAGNMVCWN